MCIRDSVSVGIGGWDRDTIKHLKGTQYDTPRLWRQHEWILNLLTVRKRTKSVSILHVGLCIDLFCPRFQWFTSGGTYVTSNRTIIYSRVLLLYYPISLTWGHFTRTITITCSLCNGCNSHVCAVTVSYHEDYRPTITGSLNN